MASRCPDPDLFSTSRAAFRTLNTIATQNTASKTSARPERLRCGVIFTNRFIDYLIGRCAAEAKPGHVAEINYVHCIEGELKGDSWWSLTWAALPRFTPAELFNVQGLEIALSKQTQKALKWKYIDFKDGKVLVA